MRLDNEPLMRQGIIQGLRPEIKRDVLIQRPETLEALAEAAAISEANARAANSSASRTDAAVTAQLAEMHAMITAMQSAVISGHRQRAEVNTVDAPTTFAPSPALTTTTAMAATTTTRAIGSATATLPTPTATLGEPRSITIQLVTPDTAAPQYGAGHDVNGYRTGRTWGRGRGWRGP